MQVWSLGQEDPLGEGMATHSSILAWRIPWTEEPDRLWSTGSQRTGHDWSHLAAAAVFAHVSPILNENEQASYQPTALPTMASTHLSRSLSTVTSPSPEALSFSTEILGHLCMLFSSYVCVIPHTAIPCPLLFRSWVSASTGSDAPLLLMDFLMTEP